MDTLVATWNKPAAGVKTVTNCVIGKPVLFIHVPYTTGDGHYCHIKTYGTGMDHVLANSAYCTIGVGWEDGTHASTNVFVVIPKATSIQVELEWSGEDDKIYVFV